MKKISLFLFIFISIFLFNSCRIDDKEAIYLESGWSYSIDSIDGEYKPIDINQFPYIAKLCPKRKGHIYLKNDFILPSSLSDEVLKCFFGNIKIANEFYCPMGVSSSLQFFGFPIHWTVGVK